MDISCNSVKDLVHLLREDGDKILNASSKLSLSNTLLYGLNNSFNQLFNQRRANYSTFHVVNTSSDIIDSFLDLQFVYEFFQKTLALKILPGPKLSNNAYVVDINVFHNLKLLEIQRLSLNLVKGIKNLRDQLEYLICKRSLHNLKEVLERCGADRSQGFVWSELKEAVFSHNGLNDLDNSLEFIPGLQTLDLSHNQIQNAQQLDCLTSLKFLNLSFNQLERVPTFSNNTARCLKVLVLRNNYIENVDELAQLSNLQELDLRDNSLMEHVTLTPVAHLSALRRLCLHGNPLSFHANHRQLTAMYLHCNCVSVNFLLDHVALSKTEQRLVGSLHPVSVSLERSSSFNSTTTASTVVPVVKEMAAGMNFASLVQDSETADLANRNTFLYQVLGKDLVGMHDSGFVPGPRPASPSECSIDEKQEILNEPQPDLNEDVDVSEKKSISSAPFGSATSLSASVEGTLSDHAIKYCESDIEVLSNPSQSSIEVLSGGPTHIRCVQSATTFEEHNSTKSDLNKIVEEEHRSL